VSEKSIQEHEVQALMQDLSTVYDILVDEKFTQSHGEYPAAIVEAAGMQLLMFAMFYFKEKTRAESPTSATLTVH